MGKTKTAFVGGIDESNLSGADKYKLKQKKKAQQEAKEKQSVKGVGLKGGERVKIVGGDLPVDSESIQPEETTAGLSPKAKRGPRVRGKKHIASSTKVDRNKSYATSDAIKLVKETSYSKFDGTVEMHITVKKQGLTAQVALPYSAGKSKTIEVADEKTIKKAGKW